MLVAGLGAGVAYAVESGDSTADATEQTQVASGQGTSESQDASEDSVEEGAEGEAGGTADTADAQNAGQDDAIGDDAKTDDGSTDKADTSSKAKAADTEDIADDSDAGISTLAVDDPDHTVQGVSPRGTTINLFDYWIHSNRYDSDKSNADTNNHDDYKNRGINAGHVLKFSAGSSKQGHATANSDNVNYWTGDSWPRQGIVANRLGDTGYPKLSDDVDNGEESLSYLFDGQSVAGAKLAFMDVDGLLQVDDQGYYYYDSTKNFAQFNENTQDFTLYDAWGVKKGGASPDGQFFPFNTGDEVFEEKNGTIQAKNINSKDESIHHYFGLNMSTQFVQPDDGVIKGTKTSMTYNFSGDDDVWVYIDGVLVGDLGGIHDRTSLEINFEDGHVYVYNDANNDNQCNAGEDRYEETTLGKIMGDADVTDGLDGETFADGTYHTLDFFYLERGNTDSNMSLKYNLVVPPETDIVKVDQDGEPVADAGFAVYVANVDYEIQNDDKPVCTATTDANGKVVLLDDNDNPITFDRLWDLYGDRGDHLTQLVPDADGGGRRVNLVLRETAIPQGYRSPGDMRMYLWHKGGGEVQGGEAVNLLLADMSTAQTEGTTWQTGAYSQPTVLVTAPSTLTFDSAEPITVDTEMQGRIFAIVEKKTDNNGWVPVYDNQVDGWTVASDNSMRNVQIADKATKASFVLASSGSYQALIDGLPGRIQKYLFFGGTEYRGAYFYTTAGENEEMTASNTHRIDNTNDFGRQFAAHLYVPNIINRVIVQKTDDEDKPVDNATMGLYSDDQVEFVNGKAQLKEGAQPVQTRITGTLNLDPDKIDLDGAAVFTHLKTGTYWIVETAAPAGYAINTIPAKVIVTADGVYADAGKADDGVKVTRGVGRIVRSMLQFATADQIDTTLNHIVATKQIGVANESGTVGGWSDVLDAEKLHLVYGGDKAALDYNVETPTTSDDRRFTVDEGIPYLKVQQCKDHVTNPRVFDLGDTDISGLFTGVTIVQVTDQRVGSLKISKTVTGDVAPDVKFTFNITLKNGDKSVSGKFTAGVYDATANNRVDGSFEELHFDDKGMAAIELESGQYAVIEGLPVGTEYTVVEQKADGYTPSNSVNSIVSSTGSTAAGSIDGQDDNPRQPNSQVGSEGWAPNQTVDFVNEPLPTASFTIEKQITGRDWSTDDSFSFLVSANDDYGDAVTMPVDDNGILGTESNPIVIGTGTSDHKFKYGDITFTETGTYKFTVKEIVGNARGMKYSDAEFTVTVEVKNLTSDPTVTVARTNGTDVDGKVNDGTDTVIFINHFGRVSALPLTGSDSTARSLLIAGGGVLLVAGAAWLLSRRRRV